MKAIIKFVRNVPMVSSILFSMILGYGSVTMMVLLPEILSGTLTLTDLGLGLESLIADRSAERVLR